MANKEKKDLNELSLLDLLEALGREKDDSKWMDLWEKIINRSPFDVIMEEQESLRKRANRLEEDIKKLKNILKNHVHLNDKIYIEF